MTDDWLTFYLGFGLGFAIFVYAWFCLGDLIDGPDHKFGYAYNSGFTFFFVIPCAIPIINILAIPFIMNVIGSHTFDRIQRAWRRRNAGTI
jgi:hypothetical protein